jgi:hypothetical protein
VISSQRVAIESFSFSSIELRARGELPNDQDFCFGTSRHDRHDGDGPDGQRHELR